MIYILNNIYLLLYFYLSYFISSYRYFIYDPFYESRCIIASTYYFRKKLMMCPYFLQYIQYLFSFTVIKSLLLWWYVPHLWHVSLNLNTYKTFSDSFSSCLLNHTSIISYFYDNLSPMILMVN